jgi:hypothetical protein
VTNKFWQIKASRSKILFRMSKDFYNRIAKEFGGTGETNEKV